MGVSYFKRGLGLETVVLALKTLTPPEVTLQLYFGYLKPFPFQNKTLSYDTRFFFWIRESDLTECDYWKASYLNIAINTI